MTDADPNNFLQRHYPFIVDTLALAICSKVADEKAYKKHLAALIRTCRDFGLLQTDADIQNVIWHPPKKATQELLRAIENQKKAQVFFDALHAYQIGCLDADGDLGMQTPRGFVKYPTPSPEHRSKRLSFVDPVTVSLHSASTPAETKTAASADTHCISSTVLSSATTCVVCEDRNREILIDPCNHVCSCSECIKRLTTCPMCRCTIVSTKKIYMS